MAATLRPAPYYMMTEEKCELSPDAWLFLSGADLKMDAFEWENTWKSDYKIDDFLG